MKTSPRTRRWLDQLLHTHDTPQRTAFAYALGIFFGFSPMLGLHTILGVVFAFLLNLNKTALVPGVSFVTSQVLFADEQKYFASSEGSRITQRLIRTYPQFQTTATDRASGPCTDISCDDSERSAACVGLYDGTRPNEGRMPAMPQA